MQGCCHFWYCHNVNNEYWCSDLIQSILFNVYITNWNLPKIHDFDKLALKLDLRKKSTTGCILIKNELCFAKFYSTLSNFLIKYVLWKLIILKHNLPTTHYDAFAACATYIYTLDIKSKFCTSCWHVFFKNNMCNFSGWN